MSATTPDPRHVPDRDTSEWPKDCWELPNDPMLGSAEWAPHETAGVMRMVRAGIRGTAVAETLGAKQADVVESLENCIGDEKAAAYIGVPIHDAILTHQKAIDYLIEASS